LTTKESYYEHLGFHYVNTDGTRMTQERRLLLLNLKTKIEASVLLSCVSRKLDARALIRSQSILVDEQRVRNESIKQGLLGALGTKVGQGSRNLEDFWKIYRNVLKSDEFYALQETFNFKKHIFTRFLRECLLEQINIDEKIFGFSEFDRMRYP